MSEIPAVSGFESFGLKSALLESLNDLGYEEPTPIQRAAMPPLLEGRDVIGQAATGTGKTAAFTLPILTQLDSNEPAPFFCRALILVPTRELAMQVAEAVHTYGKALNRSVVPIYGGQEIVHQLKRLKRGADVVVATPGRALDHIRRKSLRLGEVQTVVLDEADEMLDLGFADDLEAILKELPEKRQTALFSATLPPRIAAMAGEYLRDPVRVRIESKAALEGSLPKISQVAYVVMHGMKDLALARVLDVESPERAIIFCRTRVEVERLSENLTAHGYDVVALHGGIDQDKRDRILKRFKQQGAEFLVATDVAARGLHIDKLSHVINYDLPTSPEVYVHRIGRTGRAGAAGNAINLLDSREIRLLKNIERFLRASIQVKPLPSVEDLKTQRLGVTRAEVEKKLATGELDSYRRMVEELANSAEILDVAAAAVAALHEKLTPPRDGPEPEIVEWKPAPAPRSPKRSKVEAAPAREPREERRPRDSERPPRSAAPAPHGKPRAERAGGRELAFKARVPQAPPARERPSRERAPRERADEPRHQRFVRLFISLGETAGIRPSDFVGAIANEANLTSKHIGVIKILPKHSTVEVSEDHADQVIDALQSTTIRGRKIRASLDRGISKRPA